MKVVLIIFSGFTRLRHFATCTLTAIKSIAKISYITSYLLFRTSATLKFINSKISVAIYNSFTHIVLIPISVFKHTCLLNILANLATFSTTSGTFRFFSVFVNSFFSYEIVLKGASFNPTNHGGLLSKNSFVFLIRNICASFKTFWKSLSNGWYVRLSSSRSSTWVILTLLSNVSLDTALALRICYLTSFCL